MLVLILTVLMTQLQSFNRLFLVLSVAPLGLIGVVAALLLADKPLGFVALLGVLALTGMSPVDSSVVGDSGPYWQDQEARLGVRVGEPHKAPI
jgi:multidrug efflux pump subunit AcrB